MKPRRKMPSKPHDTRKVFEVRDHLKKVKTEVKDGKFIFSGPLTIAEFCEKIKIPVGEIIKRFFIKGQIVNLNTLLNEEQIAEISIDYGFDFQVEKEITSENVLEEAVVKDEVKDLINRAPVITIMGHVDHGKTSLLDAIRQTKVVDKEAGGITQHMGAYQIMHNNKPITFIDTPGHEAFSAMRARGANVTDIVIIVVAADDGMMPQTEEAIDHAKVANVPIIVFINKMDKPSANPKKVISDLSAKDLIPEEFGGDTIFVKGSARDKKGISELLETIITLSEVTDLKANPNRTAMGIVLESRVDAGLGPIATLLVKNGTMVKSDIIVAGHSWGKLKMLFNSMGESVTKVLPGTPVVTAGWTEVPKAGDKFAIVSDERDAKAIALSHKIKKNREENSKLNLSEEIRKKIKSGELKNLNILIKTDVNGSLEAIKGLIQRLSVDGTMVSLIRGAIGQVNESDISLAKTANALIYSFNIKPTPSATAKAKEYGMELKYHNIIYKLEEDLIQVLKGHLDPVYEEEILGEAEILQIWSHTDIGKIAGSKVISGSIKRGAQVRVIREGKVVYQSEISSLKSGKDDVKEVKSGKECGMTIKNYNDFKVGDTVECFRKVEKKN